MLLSLDIGSPYSSAAPCSGDEPLVPFAVGRERRQAGDCWPGGNEKWPEEPFKLNETLHYPYAGTHYGDGFIVYPGPRPSIRLKNIRDGAEDYGYLTRVAQLADNGDTAARAKELLDGIRPAVFVDTHHFNRCPETLLEYRERLGQFIEGTDAR